MEKKYFYEEAVTFSFNILNLFGEFFSLLKILGKISLENKFQSTYSPPQRSLQSLNTKSFSSRTNSFCNVVRLDFNRILIFHINPKAGYETYSTFL